MKFRYSLLCVLWCFLLVKVVYAEHFSCKPDAGYEYCVRFTYSGMDQSFTVPLETSQLKVKLWGAGGGGANKAWYTSQGGGAGGGFALGDVAVKPGEKLTVMVGQGGVVNGAYPTYGGGGAGGKTYRMDTVGGSGGGMSGLWRGAVNQVANALMIAGGGGGASPGADNSHPLAGGGGGVAGGQDTNPEISGRGGTQTAGGAAATGGWQESKGSPGTQFFGGNASPIKSAWEGGGGGGVGWFGGGAGVGAIQSQDFNGVGGGGSGFVNGVGVTNSSMRNGENAAWVSCDIFAKSGGADDSHYIPGVGQGHCYENGGNGEVVIEYNRASTKLTVSVDWVDAIPGDESTVTSSGFDTNITALRTTAPVGIAASPVATSPGQTGKLLQVFSSSNKALYTISYACNSSNSTISADGTLILSPKDTNISCVVRNQRIDYSVSGRVFKDDGAGGGVANDGVQNGTEGGVAGVMLRLTDCGSKIFSITQTNGVGDYSLSADRAVVGNVCIQKHGPAGWLTTGVNSPKGAVYVRPADSIRFSLAAKTNYSRFNFGVIPPNQWGSDISTNAVAGGIVGYAHQFVAATKGSVKFSVSGGDGAWPSQLYLDPKCLGEIDPSLTPLIAAKTVNAGKAVCVILKQSVPGGAKSGESRQAVITATFDYSGCDLPNATYRVTDITRLSDTALFLEKRVRNVNTPGGIKWQLSNRAKSGEILEYQIRYQNMGATSVNVLVISDEAPAYTMFVSADASKGPGELGTPVVDKPDVGKSGPLRWTFPGKLGAGEGGAVTFQVKVE